MRIPPQFFSDDSHSGHADKFPEPQRFPAHLEDTLEEGTLKLPGVAPTATPLLSVRLGEILEPLTEALRANHGFLADFADDEIQLPADLIECLNAFEQIRRAA